MLGKTRFAMVLWPQPKDEAKRARVSRARASPSREDRDPHGFLAFTQLQLLFRLLYRRLLGNNLTATNLVLFMAVDRSCYTADANANTSVVKVDSSSLPCNLPHHRASSLLGELKI
jgi:hypothetical protein